MKLTLLLPFLRGCTSLRATLVRGEESTHLTALRVVGSLSEQIMGDKYNVKEIFERILRADDFGAGNHVANITKIKKSDNNIYFLCEWESDVPKDAFATYVAGWTTKDYATLNQWARANAQPKIVGLDPFEFDKTTDIQTSHFEISSIESFERWDNRPPQYRMVKIKVTGTKRDDLIKKNKLKDLLEYVLLNAVDPNRPSIEIKKIVPHETEENVVRVGFVTKMTEDEITKKLGEMDYYPLNNWVKQKHPKQIFENGTTVNSSTLEMKIIFIRPDFESSWYSEYHSTRVGYYTHLTAFNVIGTLSETTMLDATNVKVLIEHIITEEKHRVESNPVTIMKLRKSDNEKSILCEWRSDLLKDKFDVVFGWADEKILELNGWAQTNLGSKNMDDSDFKIEKITFFEWDIRFEELHMVAIKLTGSKRDDVTKNDKLKVLLEKIFMDESDLNHPQIKIWKQSVSKTDMNVERVAFLTKIPQETITEKLDSMDYHPLNIWARKTLITNGNVHELKIMCVEDDFELNWYREWLEEP